MPHHKSTVKRVRTSAVARLRNRAYRRRLANAMRKVREAETFEQGQELLKSSVSLIDKLVNKKIIHRNNAANRKAKLARMVAKLQK
jgi:small subunit ribosomal protein S20